MLIDLPRFYTLDETAAVLRVTKAALRAAIARGDGPATTKATGRVLVADRDLRAWLDSGRKGQTR